MYVGLGTCASRILVAMLTSLYDSDLTLHLYYNIPLLLSGVITIAVPYMRFWFHGSYLAYSVLFGALSNCHPALLAPITQSLVGCRNLKVAYGLQHTIATFSILGEPIFAGNTLLLSSKGLSFQLLLYKLSFNL